MDTVLVKVSAFIFIILSGVLASRTGKLGAHTGEVLSKIVFNLTLPAAVIHAFGAAEFSLDMLSLIVVGFVFTATPYFVFYALTLKDSRADRIYYLLNGVGFNIGSFALAFVQAFFPARVVVAACLFDAGNALVATGAHYALTQVLLGDGKTDPSERFAEKGSHRAALKQIAQRLFSSVPFDLYLILIGLALLGIKIPEGILTFLEPISNANAFLSMFMLGLMVQVHVSKSGVVHIVKLLGGRLIMSGIMCAVALNLLPFSAEICSIIAVLVWAPIASLGPVFTLWMGGDHGLAGLTNTLSILIGIIAMTLTVVVTGSLG